MLFIAHSSVTVEFAPGISGGYYLPEIFRTSFNEHILVRNSLQKYLLQMAVLTTSNSPPRWSLELTGWYFHVASLFFLVLLHYTAVSHVTAFGYRRAYCTTKS